jgi:signal transduction histidine kinase
MAGLKNFLTGEPRGRDAEEQPDLPGGDEHSQVHTATEIFQDLSDAIDSEIALLDDDGVVVMVNSAWCDGLSPETKSQSWVGLSLWELLQVLDPTVAEGRLRWQLDYLKAGTIRRLTHRYVATTPIGRRQMQLRISSMRIGAPVHFVVVHEDLGPEPETSENPQKSAGEVLRAQEEARQRIAMELHDSTSQHLVALGLGMVRLRRITGGGEDTRDVLADMSLSVNEMVKEIRVLSYLLKPPELEREGLAATVRAFVKGFGARTGLVAEFHAEGAVDTTPPTVQHASFRIIQEALSNVYRHANATAAVIRLRRGPASLKVSISDDGSGIPGLRAGGADAVTVGVGISGMRTRVAQLGGRFDITCAQRGTVVTAELPAPAIDAKRSQPGV